MSDQCREPSSALSGAIAEERRSVEIRNGRDVAGQVMTKPDQEGLIVKNIINRDIAGARGIILLSSELPPGKAHLFHRHPTAEQLMYVLDGASLALSEGGAMRLREGAAV